MRQIGILPDPQQAQTFADYLLTLGMSTKLDASETGVALWIRDEDHLDQARQELASFRTNPSEARYVEAARHAHNLRQESQRKETQYRRNMIDMRRRWSASGSMSQRPVTMLLILASAAVTVLSSWGSWSSPIARDLSIERAFIGPMGEIRVEGNLNAIRHGQVWRLFTPALLHASPLHLIFNMLLLYDLGGMIESRRGPVSFALLVLATAFVSNLGQYFWQGPHFLGMSGVDYGLFGYICMKSWFDPRAGLYIHSNTVFMLLAWFVICFMSTMHVANGAHAAGLAAGVVIGYAPIGWRKIVGS